MVYINVVLLVKNPDDIEEIRELLAEQARLSSEEPGCVRFEVYHSKNERNQFFLVEQWGSEEDLARHRKAKAFTELYIPKVIPLVERNPHPSDRIWPN